MAQFSKRRIAAGYLPDRYHYYYALSKLATDPLYAAVLQAFEKTREPLLDIGCGIGLLLQYLRARGVDAQYFGIDNDSIKISMARSTAARKGLQRARFEVCDPAKTFPMHRGSVALLDVLQFFERDVRDELIANVAKSIAPQGKLVIRSGLEDNSWRANVSRAGDRFAYLANWMRTSPKSQPTRDELTQQLQLHGLKAEFRPLWGYTPFNNWLVVASRV